MSTESHHTFWLSRDQIQIIHRRVLPTTTIIMSIHVHSILATFTTALHPPRFFNAASRRTLRRCLRNSHTKMSPHLLQSNSTAVIATTTARPHSHDNRSLINKLQLLVILNVVVVTVSFGCAAASAKLAIKTIAQHGAPQPTCGQVMILGNQCDY
jgi:hypothetical protein